MKRSKKGRKKSIKRNLKLADDREDGYLLPLEKSKNQKNAWVEYPDCGKLIIDVPLLSQLPREVVCDCKDEDEIGEISFRKDGFYDV